MVKTVMSSMTMAMVVADEVSLLQVSSGVRESQGQRILAAVATQGKDAICVQAAAGDVAPVTGSFTAKSSQQAVEVGAGSVAGEAGSFCVTKQDVLLIQRTFGLNTAGDFEAALGSKNKATTTTTTTTMDHTTFDFEGDLTKVVTVKAGECPSVEAGPVQTVEASVSDKEKKLDEKKLDADQLRVCGCRSFLKSATDAASKAPVNQLEQMLAKAAASAVAEPTEAASAVLLQRNLDNALASKNTAKSKETTTTTTTSTIDPKLAAEFKVLGEACTLASKFPGSWTMVAREFNNANNTALFNSFNISGGWEHCDKSWVVQGACREFLTPLVTCETFDQGRKCSTEGLTAACCTQNQNYLLFGTRAAVNMCDNPVNRFGKQKCETPPTVTCDYTGKDYKNCSVEGVTAPCCTQLQGQMSGYTPAVSRCISEDKELIDKQRSFCEKF